MSWRFNSFFCRTKFKKEMYFINFTETRKSKEPGMSKLWNLQSKMYSKEVLIQQFNSFLPLIFEKLQKNVIFSVCDLQQTLWTFTALSLLLWLLNRLQSLRLIGSLDKITDGAFTLRSWRVIIYLQLDTIYVFVLKWRNSFKLCCIWSLTLS